MAIPEPKPGLVIRYDFLWNREFGAGRDHGKDRPACLVAASDPALKPRYVVILPITHSRPTGDTIGVELPQKVRAFLGLDDDPCWVILSEHDVDEWPNAGLQPLPGRSSIFHYGFLPPSLFAKIKAQFLDLATQNKSTRVRR